MTPRKRVSIVSASKHAELGKYDPDMPVVLVDGEPLEAVTAFKVSHDYGQGLPPVVELTLLGVDVDLDLDVGAEYLVRVVLPTRAPDG